MVPFERLIVSYSLSVANMDVSLAVSTQYTNVTAGHRTTAYRPRLCSIAFLEGSHDGAEIVAWGGHTPLPLLAAWLAAWLNPDWIGQWAVRRRHGFLSQ